MRIFSLKQVEVGLHQAPGPSKARGEGRAGPMFPLLLSLGELSLIVVPNASPNVLLVAGRIRGSGFAAIFLGGRGAGGPGGPWWKPESPYPATAAERSDPVFEEGDGAFETILEADLRFPVKQ